MKLATIPLICMAIIIYVLVNTLAYDLSMHHHSEILALGIIFGGAFSAFAIIVTVTIIKHTYEEKP